jgi:hypothetical protein
MKQNDDADRNRSETVDVRPICPFQRQSPRVPACPYHHPAA